MQPIQSEISVLAKNLSAASFKALSDGIGLVSFKQTAVFYEKKEPSNLENVQKKEVFHIKSEEASQLKITPNLPLRKEINKKETNEANYKKDLTKETNLIFRLFLSIAHIAISHLIDLVFVCCLLIATILGADFFLTPKEKTSTFLNQLEKVIFSFPKEWGRFLFSLDGLLVCYVLFFIYLVFFRFTAGHSIGSFVVHKFKKLR